MRLVGSGSDVQDIGARFRMQGEEIKAVFESEKRRIFAIVAGSFATYFDLCVEIDERSFM
jgi:hypothetical protein